MLFNTLNYAIFFAFAFAGSWALARASKGWARSIFLLVLSYGFYAAGFDKNLNWNFKYLPLIFASSTVDFFLARAIARLEDPRRRRMLLAVTVVGLAALGALGARLGRARLLPAALRVSLGGAAAMGFAAAIGQLFDVAVT